MGGIPHLRCGSGLTIVCSTDAELGESFKGKFFESGAPYFSKTVILCVNRGVLSQTPIFFFSFLSFSWTTFRKAGSSVAEMASEPVLMLPITEIINVLAEPAFNVTIFDCISDFFLSYRFIFIFW